MGREEKESLNQKQKTSEENKKLQSTRHLKKCDGKFIAWNHGLSLTSKVFCLWDILWSWLIGIAAYIFNIYIQTQALEYPSSHLHE